MRRPGQMELARVVLARHLKRVGVRLKAKGKGVGLGRASAAGLLGFDLGFALNHLALLFATGSLSSEPSW